MRHSAAAASANERHEDPPFRFYLIKNFSMRSPPFNFAASHLGLRPRPVQVSDGSSGLAYFAATVRPFPPRPPKISLTLKPALAISASTLLRTSARVRSSALALAFFNFNSSSCSSLKDILSRSLAIIVYSLEVHRCRTLRLNDLKYSKSQPFSHARVPVENLVMRIRAILQLRLIPSCRRGVVRCSSWPALTA